MQLRDEVLFFAEIFEKIMEENDPNLGDSWKSIDCEELIAKYESEFYESLEAIFNRDHYNLDDIMLKLSRTGLMAMMVWYRAKMLKETQAEMK